MSDAQIDGNDNGQAGEDIANDFIGERTNAEAVFWYGAMSFGSAGSAMLLYIFFNDKYYPALARQYTFSHMGAFLPVGISWLMVSFFDSSFMRGVFGDVVGISILGPFFFHWYATGIFILDADNGG